LIIRKLFGKKRHGDKAKTKGPGVDFKGFFKGGGGIKDLGPIVSSKVMGQRKKN
jgi:hypothetical protein